MRIVRFAATWGAAIGIGIAVVMVSLSEIQTFSDIVTVMIMVATVSLCPTFLLGPTLHIESKILLYVITIVGNAIVYGIASAIIGLGFALFQRVTARNHNEEGESEKHRKT